MRWWKASGDEDAAGALWTWIDRLRTRWAADNWIDLVHEAIYEGRPLGTSGDYPALQHLRMRRAAPANLNVTQGLVDTATARLTKRRPMPCVSADDAGWTEKLFAKRTSRILRRKMGGSKIEKIKPDIIRDMIIRGTGCAKVVRYGGDVAVERIPIYELVVDPREARYGEPRSLAHIKPIPREVLIEEFPEHAEALEQVSEFTRMDPWTQYAYDGPTFSDHIEVGEAWHLPSGPNAIDGQHIITCRGVVLLREPWKRPRFPIARCHWSNPLRGFRGRGLVELLSGPQAKLNDLIHDIQEAVYWAGMLHVFLPRGANINKHHLRARHPNVVETDGPAPTFVPPNAISPSTMQLVHFVIQEMHDLSGIDQGSATSQSSLGPDASGKALETMEDIKSDRFAHVESGWMQFNVELGQLQIDEARALYDEAHGNPLKVDDPITKKELAAWIAEHDWNKVKIDEGDYHLTIEPINFLPDSRAGKLSFVKELSGAGLIPDPTMTAALFDEPDIARANRSVLGAYHALEYIMEKLADPTVPMFDIAPDQSMNLPLGVLMAKAELNEAFSLEAPDEVLQRYRDWIEAAKGEIDKAANAPSLAGMQANNMGASPNAATLQPGLGGAPPPMGPPGAGPMPMPPGPGGPGVPQGLPQQGMAA